MSISFLSGICLTVVVVGSWCPRALAAEWTGGAGDGLWTTPANWSGGTVPGTGDQASFTGAVGDVRIASEVSVGSIRVASGTAVVIHQEAPVQVLGACEIAGGIWRSAAGLTIGGDLTIAPTASYQSGTGTVALTGTAIVANPSPANAFYDLTVAAPGRTTTLASDITVAHRCTVAGGTLDFHQAGAGHDLHLRGTGQVLDLQGRLWGGYPNGGQVVYEADGGEPVEVAGGSYGWCGVRLVAAGGADATFIQTGAIRDTDHLVTSAGIGSTVSWWTAGFGLSSASWMAFGDWGASEGGTIFHAADAAISVPALCWTTSAHDVLDLGSSSWRVGDWAVWTTGAQVMPGTSTVIVLGGGIGPSWAAVPQAFGTLGIASSGTATVYGPVTATGDLRVVSGTLATLGRPLTIGRDLTIAASSGLQAGASLIAVGRAIAIDPAGAFQAGTSSVLMTGSGTVANPSPVNAFYDLTVAAAGRTTTLATTTTVTNRCVVEAGTLDFHAAGVGHDLLLRGSGQVLDLRGRLWGGYPNGGQVIYEAVGGEPIEVAGGSYGWCGMVLRATEGVDATFVQAGAIRDTDHLTTHAEQDASVAWWTAGYAVSSASWMSIGDWGSSAGGTTLHAANSQFSIPALCWTTQAQDVLDLGSSTWRVGDWAVWTPSAQVLPGSSTVTVVGGGIGPSWTPVPQAFGTLEVAATGAVTLYAPVSTAADLRLTTGALVAGIHPLTVAGNLAVGAAAALQAGASTVTLTGTSGGGVDQSVDLGTSSAIGTLALTTGGRSIALAGHAAAIGTLRADPGVSVAIADGSALATTHLRLLGTAAAPITLAGAAPGTVWRLAQAASASGGSQALAYVRAGGSDASGGAEIDATHHGIDLGGTTHWNFGGTLPPDNTPPVVAGIAVERPTPTTIRLTAAVTDNGGISNLRFTWSLPEGTTGVVLSGNGATTDNPVTATVSAAGAYPFTLVVTDAGGLSATAQATVTVARAVATISVSPFQPVVNAGATQAFTAVATDQFGAMWQEAGIAWTATGGMITAQGLFTAGSAGGPAVVTAAVPGALGQAFPAINPAPVVGAIVVDPSPVTGTTASLRATFSDRDEAGVDDASALTVHWSSANAGVSFGGTSPATATFTAIGDYPVRVTATDLRGLIGTAETTVIVVATPTGLAVTSVPVMAPPGARQFTATAQDQFGNPLTPQPLVTWTLTGGGGSIDANGLFTPDGSGTVGTVGANGGGFATTAPSDGSDGGGGDGQPPGTVTLVIRNGLTGDKHASVDGVDTWFTNEPSIGVGVTLALVRGTAADMTITSDDGGSVSGQSAATISFPLSEGAHSLVARVTVILPDGTSTVIQSPSLHVVCDRTGPKLSWREPGSDTTALGVGLDPTGPVLLLSGASDDRAQQIRAMSGWRCWPRAGLILHASISSVAGLADSTPTVGVDDASLQAALIPDSSDSQKRLLEVRGFEGIADSVAIDPIDLSLQGDGLRTLTAMLRDRCGNQVAQSQFLMWVKTVPSSARIGFVPWSRDRFARDVGVFAADQQVELDPVRLIATPSDVVAVLQMTGSPATGTAAQRLTPSPGGFDALSGTGAVLWALPSPSSAATSGPTMDQISISLRTTDAVGNQSDVQTLTATGKWRSISLPTGATTTLGASNIAPTPNPNSEAFTHKASASATWQTVGEAWPPMTNMYFHFRYWYSPYVTLYYPPYLSMSGFNMIGYRYASNYIAYGPVPAVTDTNPQRAVVVDLREAPLVGTSFGIMYPGPSSASLRARVASTVANQISYPWISQYMNRSVAVQAAYPAYTYTRPIAFPSSDQPVGYAIGVSSAPLTSETKTSSVVFDYYSAAITRVYQRTAIMPVQSGPDEGLYRWDSLMGNGGLIDIPPSWVGDRPAYRAVASATDGLFQSSTGVPTDGPTLPLTRSLSGGLLRAQWTNGATSAQHTGFGAANLLKLPSDVLPSGGQGKLIIEASFGTPPEPSQARWTVPMSALRLGSADDRRNAWDALTTTPSVPLLASWVSQLDANWSGDIESARKASIVPVPSLYIQRLVFRARALAAGMAALPSVDGLLISYDSALQGAPDKALFTGQFPRAGLASAVAAAQAALTAADIAMNAVIGGQAASGSWDPLLAADALSSRIAAERSRLQAFAAILDGWSSYGAAVAQQKKPYDAILKARSDLISSISAQQFQGEIIAEANPYWQSCPFNISQSGFSLPAGSEVSSFSVNFDTDFRNQFDAAQDAANNVLADPQYAKLVSASQHAEGKILVLSLSTAGMVDAFANRTRAVGDPVLAQTIAIRGVSSDLSGPAAPLRQRLLVSLDVGSDAGGLYDVDVKFMNVVASPTEQAAKYASANGAHRMKESLKIADLAVLADRNHDGTIDDADAKGSQRPYQDRNHDGVQDDRDAPRFDPPGAVFFAGFGLPNHPKAHERIRVKIRGVGLDGMTGSVQVALLDPQDPSLPFDRGVSGRRLHVFDTATGGTEYTADPIRVPLTAGSPPEASVWLQFDLDAEVILRASLVGEDGTASGGSDLKVGRYSNGLGMDGSGLSPAVSVFPGGTVDLASGNVAWGGVYEAYGTPAFGPGFSVSYNQLDGLRTALGQGWRTSFDMRVVDNAWDRDQDGTVGPSDHQEGDLLALIDQSGRRFPFRWQGGKYVADPLAGLGTATVEVDRTLEPAPGTESLAGDDRKHGFRLNLRDNRFYDFDQWGYLRRMEALGRQVVGIARDGSDPRLAVSASDSHGRAVGLAPADFHIAQDPQAVPVPGLSGGLLTGISLQYDAQRRVTAATPTGSVSGGTPVWRLAYAADERRPDAIVPPTVPGARTQAIAYTPADPLQPVTGVSIGGMFGGQTAYVIDAASGCWTSCTVPGVVAVTTTRTLTTAKRQLQAEATGRLSTSFTYDANGNLAGRNVAGGTSEQFTWGDGGIDGANLRLTATLAGAGATTTSYVAGGSAAGAVEHVRYADGGEERFTYTADGWLATRLDQRGKTWTYQDHDAYGEPLTIIHPMAGRRTMRTYHDGGRGWQRSETTFLGQTTAWDYDGQGRLERTTLPSGAIIRDQRDALGNVVQHQEANSPTAVTTMVYDLAGRVVRLTAPTLLPAITTYAVEGDRIHAVTRRGTRIVGDLLLDLAGREVSRTDYRQLAKDAAPSAVTTTTSYTAEGWPMTIRDPRGGTMTTTYDSAGRVIAIQGRAGGASSLTYYPTGWVETRTDADQATTRFAYDACGRTTWVTNPAGGTTGFDYDPAGNATGVTPPVGRPLAYGYDDDGIRSSETDGLGHQHTIAIDGNDLVRTSPTRDDTGAGMSQVVTRATVAADGYVHAVASTGQRTVTIEPDPDGYAAKVMMPGRGDQVSGRDALGRVVHTESQGGGSTSVGINNLGDVTSATDERTNVTTPQVDAATGEVASTADQLTGSGDDPQPSDRTVLTRDANGNELTWRDARQRPWSATYDADDRQTGTSGPDGSQTQTVYTPGGRVRTSAVRGPSGGWRTTAYAYDAMGHVVSRTAPAMPPFSAQYDQAGRQTWTQTGSQRTSFAYDGTTALLARVTMPGGRSVVYQRDDFGRVTEETGPGSRHVEYTRDGLGRARVITRAGQTAEQAIYAPDTGDLTDYVDHEGMRTRILGRDGAGRPTGLELIPAASATSPVQVQLGYDVAGSLTRFVAGGAGYERHLDLRGREQLRVAIGGGVSESRTWRNDGTPSTATTGSSVVSYQYEPGTGRLAALVEGSARAELSYDGDGRVARLALPNGVERTLGYDAAGRVTTVTESQGSASTAWSGSYDATDGRLRMVRDPLGTQRFAYDAAGRTVGDAYDGPGGWSLLFGYDGNGNRISETGSLAPIASGAGDLATAFQPVRGTWTVAGAPLTAQVAVPVDGTTAHGWLMITQPLLLTARARPGVAGGLRGLVVAHGATGILVAGIRSTATGVVPTLWSDPADGAGASTTIAEAAEQAVGEDGWVALQVAQTPAGVLLAVDGTASLTASSGWALTGPGLLAQGGDPTAVFAEVSWLVGGTAIARASTYDASDRLLTRQTETGTETWRYGQPGIAPTVRTLVRADGSRQVTTQITDALDRIASLDRQEFDAQGLASPASQWSWTYAGGLRQAQTLSGPEGTTSFAYAGDRLVSATPPGAPTVTYTHGLGSLPLWERSGGTLTVIGRDIRGLVSARYGAAAPTENWRYTAYGDARAVGTDGTATTPTAGGLRYHGQWQVPGLHGYQMGARFYDSDLGRFATEDPARAGTNGYAYAGGDPVNRWDPSGLDDIAVEPNGSAYWIFTDPTDEHEISRTSIGSVGTLQWRQMEQVTTPSGFWGDSKSLEEQTNPQQLLVWDSSAGDASSVIRSYKKSGASLGPDTFGLVPQIADRLDTMRDWAKKVHLAKDDSVYDSANPLDSVLLYRGIARDGALAAADRANVNFLHGDGSPVVGVTPGTTGAEWTGVLLDGAQALLAARAAMPRMSQSRVGLPPGQLAWGAPLVSGTRPIPLPGGFPYHLELTMAPDMSGNGLGSVRSTIADGALKRVLGNGRIGKFTGIQDFIITTEGQIKVGKAHSAMSNGRPVLFAGTVRFNNQGEITEITNWSGHYLPPAGKSLTARALRFFVEKGIGMASAQIQEVTTP